MKVLVRFELPRSTHERLRVDEDTIKWYQFLIRNVDTIVGSTLAALRSIAEEAPSNGEPDEVFVNNLPTLSSVEDVDAHVRVLYDDPDFGSEKEHEMCRALTAVFRVHCERWLDLRPKVIFTPVLHSTSP